MNKDSGKRLRALERQLAEIRAREMRLLDALEEFANRTYAHAKVGSTKEHIADRLREAVRDIKSSADDSNEDWE